MRTGEINIEIPTLSTNNPVLTDNYNPFTKKNITGNFQQFKIFGSSKPSNNNSSNKV
jgi:hypothetical protein